MKRFLVALLVVLMAGALVFSVVSCQKAGAPQKEMPAEKKSEEAAPAAPEQPAQPAQPAQPSGGYGQPQPMQPQGGQ
jgi:uncharacterized protein involved in high-affinity Fe2+ transport